MHPRRQRLFQIALGIGIMAVGIAAWIWGGANEKTPVTEAEKPTVEEQVETEPPTPEIKLEEGKVLGELPMKRDPRKKTTPKASTKPKKPMRLTLRTPTTTYEIRPAGEADNEPFRRFGTSILQRDSAAKVLSEKLSMVEIGQSIRAIDPPTSTELWIKRIDEHRFVASKQPSTD
jgi:hypothetical protein